MTHEEAIAYASDYVNYVSGNYRIALDMAVEALKQQKVGRWKAKDFHTCYCTNCSFAFDIMKCDFMDKMRFCPNCGAKMEGSDSDAVD